MTPQRLLRSLALLLPLLLLSLALPNAALSQPAAPGPTELAPEARVRLAQAAEDSLLAPWQRDLMLRLAGTGTAAALDSSAADLRDARPALASGAEDGAWNQPLVPARNGHSAIHDPVRDRMVVFGGSSGSRLNDVWALSLAGTPAWTQLTPSGTPPSARNGHSALYDPVRDRMVVFGGSYSGSGLNDVWVLSLAGPPAWTQLTPSGSPLSARGGDIALYDPVRDRMVVFGGYSGSYLNDVWALSLAGTPAWTQLTPSDTPPSARYGHRAIYDPVRDRMVVFGGYSGSYPYLNDVWALEWGGPPTYRAWSPTGTDVTVALGPQAALTFGNVTVAGSTSVILEGAGPVLPAGMRVVGDSATYYELSTAATFSGTVTVRLMYDTSAVIADPSSVALMHYDTTLLPPAWVDITTGRDATSHSVWGVTSSLSPFMLMEPYAGAGVEEQVPVTSWLRPCAPNPARGTTSVSYALAQAGRVQLGVYDVSGRLVRRLMDGERRAGVETVIWNGTAESGARLQAGIYFVRLTAPGFRETRRVILLK